MRICHTKPRSPPIYYGGCSAFGRFVTFVYGLQAIRDNFFFIESSPLFFEVYDLLYVYCGRGGRSIRA
jgi:hypothetical protein